MISNPFTKAPVLSKEEKEKKAEAFVNFEEEATHQKEPTKNLYLRVPNSYWKDIQKIVSKTGLSMNATCLELLRPAIRDKLKELA